MSFQDRFAILSALTGKVLKDVLRQVSGGNTVLCWLPVAADLPYSECRHCWLEVTLYTQAVSGSVPFGKGGCWLRPSKQPLFFVSQAVPNREPITGTQQRLHQNDQTGSEAHPHFPEGNAAGAW